MSIVLGVVRHGINEEYAWLPEVSELIRRFSRPLPKCLACNDFHNSLPLRTREILEEALQSPVLAQFFLESAGRLGSQQCWEPNEKTKDDEPKAQ